MKVKEEPLYSKELVSEVLDNMMAPTEERSFLQILMNAEETKSGLLKTTVDENVKTYISGAMGVYADMVCDLFRRFEKQYSYIHHDYRPWIWEMSTDFFEYTKPLINDATTIERLIETFNDRIVGYYVREDKMLVVFLDYLAEECAVVIDPNVFDYPSAIHLSILTRLWLQVKRINENMEKELSNIKWIPSEEDEKRFSDIILLGKRLEQFIKTNGEDLYKD